MQSEVKANVSAIKTIYPEYFPLHTLKKILNAKFCILEDLTRSPESTRIYVLVLLLTRAFCPPLVGVGWSSRQLSGCSRGSGGGVTFFLKSSVCMAKENTQI